MNPVKIKIQMPKVLTWNILLKKQVSFHVSFLYNIWKHFGFVCTASLVIYWQFDEVVGNQLTSWVLIKWQSTKSSAQQVREWRPQPQPSKTGYHNNFRLKGAMLWTLCSPCSCFYSFSLAKHLVTFSSSIVSPEYLKHLPFLENIKRLQILLQAVFKPSCAPCIKWDNSSI